MSRKARVLMGLGMFGSGVAVGAAVVAIGTPAFVVMAIGLFVSGVSGLFSD